MGFIKNAFKFIFSPTASRTTGILVILIIVLAIPLTVIVSQKEQEIRQRAASNECIPPYLEGKGCFSSENSCRNYGGSYWVGSCTDTTTGESGKYCYGETNVGKSCTDDAGNLGTCNDQTICVASIVSPPTPTPTPPCATYYQDDICVTLPTTPTATSECTINNATTKCVDGDPCTIDTCSNDGRCIHTYNPSNPGCASTPAPTFSPNPCNVNDCVNQLVDAGKDFQTANSYCQQTCGVPTSAPIPPTSTPISTVQPTAQQPTSTPTQPNIPPVTPTSSLSGDFDGNGCVGIGDFKVWSKAYANSVSMPNGKIPTLLDFNVWYNAMITTSQDKICKGG